MTRARNAGRLASYWAAGLPARVVEAPEPVTSKFPVADEVGLGKTKVTELRHGYTLADLHSLARLAVHTAGTMAGDWHERYNTAHSAIAEALYAAEQPPGRNDLVRAGQLAIYAVVDDDRQHKGYYRRKTDGATHGAFSSPAFRTYWWDLCGSLPARSPEDPIVERHALAQILPHLTPGQRDALMALAVYEDYRKAASALGLSYVAFVSQIANARRRFLTLWHDGEPPSRVWGCDRRAGVRAGETRTGGTTMDAVRRRARARREATP